MLLKVLEQEVVLWQSLDGHDEEVFYLHLAEIRSIRLQGVDKARVVVDLDFLLDDLGRRLIAVAVIEVAIELLSVGEQPFEDLLLRSFHRASMGIFAEGFEPVLVDLADLVHVLKDELVDVAQELAC